MNEERDPFAQEIKAAADEIKLKEASSSQRKGVFRIRDALVFTKVAWSESMSFASPVQSAFIFIGLMTSVVLSINAGIRYVTSAFGISHPFQLPLEITSIFAFIAILFIFGFGFIAVRYLGTYRSSQEISTQHNPGFRAIRNKVEEVSKKQTLTDAKVDKILRILESK